MMELTLILSPVISDHLDFKFLHALFLIAEGIEEIDTILFDSDNDRDCMMESIKLNATHGKQLSQTEKKELARKMYLQNVEETQINNILSVSERTLRNYLRDVKVEQVSKRDQGIKELWENGTTIRRIAEIMGLSKTRVDEIVSTFGKVAETGQLIPTVRQSYLNWWENPEDLLTTRPKKLPVWVIENFLYMFTHERDLIMEYGNPEIASNIELTCHSWDREYCTEKSFESDSLITPSFIFVDLLWDEKRKDEILSEAREYLTDIAKKTESINVYLQPVIVFTFSSDKWDSQGIYKGYPIIYDIMKQNQLKRIGRISITYQMDRSRSEELRDKMDPWHFSMRNDEHSILQINDQEIELFCRNEQNATAVKFANAYDEWLRQDMKERPEYYEWSKEYWKALRKSRKERKEGQ